MLILTGICVKYYSNFDAAVKVVAELYKGALIAKADIESAFRLLPIHPEDFCLIGMQIEDLFFVYKSLSGRKISWAHHKIVILGLEIVLVRQLVSVP